MMQHHRWEIEKISLALKAEKVRASSKKTNKHIPARKKQPASYHQAQVRLQHHHRWQIGRITSVKLSETIACNCVGRCSGNCSVKTKVAAASKSTQQRPIASFLPFLHLLPSCVIQIVIAAMVDLTSECQLPESLTSLVIIEPFFSYQSIESLHLPASLKHLQFRPHARDCFSYPMRWNLPIERLVLPAKLESLYFEGGFNSTIEKLILPPQLTVLRFDGHFNQSVNRLVLPSSLTELYLGFDFNQPISQLVLPSSLQKLELDGFNQPIDQLVLPSSLQELEFGYCFNQPISRLVLPPALRVLQFRHDFNQPVETLILNEGLEILRFGMDDYSDHFAQPIERLRLPSTLTELVLGLSFQHPLREWNPPASLTSFKLTPSWPCSPDQLILPPNLDRFQIPSMSGAVIDSRLKLSSSSSSSSSCMLTHLIMPSNNYVEWSQFMIPDSVTNLTLGNTNQPLIEWKLPSQLHTLTLGDEWNLPPASQLNLPPSLHIIVFGTSFSQRLDDVVWPPALVFLRFRCHNPTLTPDRLPRNLPATMKRVELPWRCTSVYYWMELPRGCQFAEGGVEVSDEQRDQFRTTYLAANKPKTSQESI